MGAMDSNNSTEPEFRVLSPADELAAFADSFIERLTVTQPQVDLALYREARDLAIAKLRRHLEETERCS